ncbi:DUF4397 domain-containing protein [Pseudobacter ginsenosidimutans]|uniref:DUF4397 domain-containing protein n=1 Tax=Pseudobacter ginsenosidimutans TaxID=661488 RepID=A0A4Q7M7E6_9BACT|nr:DUF4397 domain-containing protein [Pseudobacter ginsenosidimutans]QEC42575.1 DUF4397 domain-containing protein [Pseudobacter ginsenosidimutans]RZS63936.1 hypothetical protein EV199_6036 [Pseudobacter ginsenosidimutans]
MSIRLQYSSGLMATLLLLAACKKDKSDFGFDNRPVIDNQKKSNVRIVNLSAYNQVVADGDSLTNFVVRGPSDPMTGRYPGTKYFPADGRLGKIWEIPMDLFGTGDKTELTISDKSYSGFNSSVGFTAENSYSNPTDYILLPFEYFTGQPKIVPVTRGVTGPSKPDHIKIRIINLTGNINNPVFTEFGTQETLNGAVTLAYADGTPVSDKTSHISTTAMVSEYVEVPYGTYQFRVLTENGKQFPSPFSGLNYRIIDPVTSTYSDDYGSSSNLVFNPVAVYQPGGVYTVIVTPQRFNYHINEMTEESFLYQNSMQVITDISPAANATYFRMQAVNALRDEEISFVANSQAVGGALKFGEVGTYANLINGAFKVEAKNAAGQVIATAEQELRANMNYTAWLYPAADGAAKLLIVANDLSGVQYAGGSEDGTYDRLKHSFFLFKRFLNFSPDNQYITYTLDNGQPISTNGSVNLQPGIPVIVQPYLGTTIHTPSYQIMAYRSAPAVVPGTWANDIPVLHSEDFIARKSLYNNAGKALPVHENGIFTVALIGSAGSIAPKAKMMIVKHNK